ncbi:MAG: CZB domain-containing protein [Acidobacteria bacterium]|nr:CZB domain-containing protein [Acidobacteriota bacterium]
MDLTEVIISHAHWRQRFAEYLEGQGQMDLALVEADNQCEYGRWLYGEGQRYGDLPEFAGVVEMHRRFHAVAGQVMRLAPTLPPGKALDLIRLNSAFANASTEFVTALCVFRDAVEKAEAAGVAG